MDLKEGFPKSELQWTLDEWIATWKKSSGIPARIAFERDV
jgi:hypothetical protein